jgi:hypothetical protein
MLIDTRTTFAWDVALPGIAGSAGTAKIGLALDLRAAPTDMGEGYPMYLVIVVGTAFAGGTSAAFNLVTADNVALSSNPVTLLSTPAITTANLPAGATAIVVAIPKANYKRYLGLTVTEVGDYTAGTIKAFLTVDPPAWRAYPEGNN